MKKNKAILAAILMVTSVSGANGSLSNEDAALISSAVPFMITSAPLFTIGASTNRNDIMMVNQDAVIAMETGFVSESLASVIEMLKASEAQFAAASDADIIKFILDLNQTTQ